jgi:NhaA family Na+:H+ antiporter
MKQKKNLLSFPITSFISEAALGGILLIIATIVALIWANTGDGSSYADIWYKTKLSFSLGDFGLSKSLQHWINDGLMAIFFFTVGLEIKREIIGGELSSPRKALLPIGAAIGGMAIPAIFYMTAIGWDAQYADGWGVPMATDIAFALGILALLGKRVNINLKIFLTALAIADDLGAILVIALFYTESINTTALIEAFFFLAVLVGANRLGVRRTTFYAVVGLAGVWLSFFYSGVHATIAGVLIAFAIPARPKVDESTFIDKLGKLLSCFNDAKPNDNKLLTSRQAHLVDDIEKLSNDAHTPLQKLEHSLHPVVAFMILPLFALANAGVRIEGNILDVLFSPVALGIIAGLVAGKAVGVTLFTELFLRLKISDMPDGVKRKDILGAGFLAGIGFTMSIFISQLAFQDDVLLQAAKVGIFAASFISALLGVAILLKK